MTPPSLEPLDEHKIYDELIQDKTLTGTLFQSQIRGIAKLICARFGASGQKGYDEKAMTVAYDSGYATGYEACKSGQRGVKFPSKVILTHVHDPGGCMCSYCAKGRVWNEAINACQQAFEEAQNSARLTDG